MLQIKLIRSPIGMNPKSKKVLESLGLKRPGDSVIKANTPQIRGAVKKVLPFLIVDET